METQDLKKQFTEKRIKNLSEARALWGLLQKDAIIRKDNFAKILNQLNGGKPFDEEDLVRLGQGWRCNVNFRDASSTLEQVLIGYWRLMHDTTNLISANVHSDDPNAETYAQIFQENFNRFIDDWGDAYVRNYLLLSMNHVGFGSGPVFWNDPKSPRWEPVRTGDMYVPPRAKADVASLEFCMIEQELEVSSIWAKVRTPEKRKAAEAMGWNYDAMMLFLHHKIHGNDVRPQPGDYVKIEDNIRDNEISVTNRHGPARVMHLYVKEWDGKISTYIFSPNVSHGEMYLFDNSSNDKRPEDMRRQLACIFFEAGNGLFWGSKGFGQKNYQLAVIQNRLKSRAVDRTILDGLNFRDLSDGGLTTVPILNVGPINVLPKELEQIQAYPHGSTIGETISMLDYQSNSNNARYRDQSKQIAQTDTVGQAKMLAGIQSQVDIANATLYLKQFGLGIFTEMFRRLRIRGNSDPDASKFRKRCLDAGIPDVVFYDAEVTVTTGADPGAASLSLQAEYAKEGMAMAATDGDFNGRWFKERYVSAHFGASAIKKALRPVDANTDLAAKRAAIMENDAMGNGHALPVDPKDNHAAQIPEHLTPLESMVSQYRASGKINPDAFIALQNVIPHLSDHFKYLEGNKLMDPVRKQLWPRFTAVQSAAEGLFNQLTKLDRTAQDNGMVSRDPGASPGGADLAGMAGAIEPQGGPQPPEGGPQDFQ